MAFFDEIITTLGIDERTKTGSFVYVSPSVGLVVEGFKKLLSLNLAKIELVCKDGSKITITGSNLSAKEISNSEISLLGQIDSISFERVKK